MEIINHTVINVIIFVLAVYVGYHVVWNVTPALHTPLMAIAMFGALLTWLMIFVTHLRFRRNYRGPALAFRMWGHPFGSLLGAGLVAAILVMTAFTREFRMTMAVGIAFVVLLTLAYMLHYRHRHAHCAPAGSPTSPRRPLFPYARSASPFRVAAACTGQRPGHTALRLR